MTFGGGGSLSDDDTHTFDGRREYTKLHAGPLIPSAQTFFFYLE